VRWHRAGFRHYWRWKSRCLGGRPQIGAELRALIRRMSIENPLWGAPRIHGVTISTHIFDRRHVMGQFRGIRPLAPVRLATKPRSGGSADTQLTNRRHAATASRFQIPRAFTVALRSGSRAASCGHSHSSAHPAAVTAWSDERRARPPRIEKQKQTSHARPIRKTARRPPYDR
jgi:hypothetical protein